MQIQTRQTLNQPTDLLGIAVFQDELEFVADPGGSLLATLDHALDGELRQAISDERFRGKSGQRLAIAARGKSAAKRLVLLGLGESPAAAASDTPGLAGVQNVAATFARYAISVGASDIVFTCTSLQPRTGLARWLSATAMGIELGGYRFTKYLTSEAKDSRAIAHAWLVPPDLGSMNELDQASAIERGRRTARAIAFARDLVNEPAGHMTPKTIAQRTVSRALAAGANATVLSAEDCRARGMGLFLAVAQGSDEAPQFVHLSWTPKPATTVTAAQRYRRIVLVGKGVTFDSGGLSLKTTEGMLDMKTDMAGAAAVLAALSAVAEEQLPIEVHAIAACTENMISARAYKLGDVLTSMAGKTVEINNTDAEGRLTLADALTYSLGLEPDVILDFATLTGACIVALGPHTAGVMSNHDETRQAFLAAAHSAGEEMWPLPLPERLVDQLKSEIADLRNTGERWGGALTAGLFLKEFVSKTPWVHVDLAGPSSASKEWGTTTQGGTGFGVATILEFLRRASQHPEATLDVRSEVQTPPQ